MASPPLAAPPDASGSLPERLAAVCLCIGAVVGPLALGGTATWARLGLEAAATAAVVLWSLSGHRPRRLALLPLAIAAVACLQIAPLPDGLLRLIAPPAAAAWRAAVPTSWGTVSIDPGATAGGIRRLLLGLAGAAAVADLGRIPRLRRWLAAAVAVSGMLIWTLGIAFPVDSQQRILLGSVDLKGPIAFWKTEVAEPVQAAGTGSYEWVTVGSLRYDTPAWSIGDGFGSYVISNHFSGALCLTVPLACGLWLLVTAGRLPGFVRYAVAVAGLAAAVVTIGWLADSRAGAASMLFAALVFLWIASSAGAWRRLTATLVSGYAAFLFVFFIAFFGPWTGVEQLLPPAVSRPLRGLRSDGRVVATRVAGQMLASSPVLGTGLDTFGELQPQYLGSVFHLYYAHNDYMQLLAETGLVGGCLAAGLAAVLIARGRRFRRQARVPDRLLDAGPWASLAALALHSAFDWNLHVPANAYLAAVIAGLALSSNGAAPPLAGEGGARPWLIRRRAASILLAAACAGAFVLLLRDAASTAARHQLASAVIAARQGKSAEVAATLQRAIAIAAQAARLDPADSRLARLLGQATLHLAALAPGEDRATAAGTADAWFHRASRACPTCRGVPEPLAAAGTP